MLEAHSLRHSPERPVIRDVNLSLNHRIENLNLHTQSNEGEGMMEQASNAPDLIWIAVWLTGLIIGTAFTLFQLMKRSISELKTEIGGLRQEVSGLGDGITRLRERTSGLEAKLQILTPIVLPPEIRKE